LKGFDMATPSRLLCCLLVFLLTSSASAPAPLQTTNAPQQAPAAPQALVAGCKQPCLEDGTPVKLRMSQTVSSADAHLNDRIEFEVLEDVRVSDVLVIAKTSIAWGTVTEVQPKRRMARGGKLEIVMDSVRLVDGEKAALRATKAAQGGGHVGAMTAGIVATGLLFFPAAPFFLFMHGKDVTIPKGTEVPTFVDGNFELDLTKFQQSPVTTAQAQVAATPAPTSAEISVTSNPPGADIQIDGTFVGNTPSTIGVDAGDHRIDVVKKGYASWERKVKVTSGKIEIAAELDAAPLQPESTAGQSNSK
jgi:PEGA domain